MFKKRLSGEFYLLCFVLTVFIVLAVFARGFYTINKSTFELKTALSMIFTATAPMPGFASMSWLPF